MEGNGRPSFGAGILPPTLLCTVISGETDVWEEVQMKPGNEAEMEARWYEGN